MNTKARSEYILAAKKKAMGLYKISRESLMESPSFNFMVYEFSMWDEISEELEEWDDYVSINEETYVLLHRNLCIKFKHYIENH